MEPIIEQHIAEVKTLLREGIDTDIYELEYLIEQEESDFNEDLDKMAAEELEVEGEEIVRGLLTKLKRIYPLEPMLYSRDSISKLAAEPDVWGLGPIEPECRYGEEQYPVIMKDLMTFISSRAREQKGHWKKPILCDVPNHKLTEDKAKNIVDNLGYLTRDIIKYLKYFRPDFWNWKVDIIVLSQYVFEKAAELTNRIIQSANMADYYYDVRDAFSYYEFPIPKELQNDIDANVENLEDLILDVISHIEKKDYHTCDLEIWYRTVLLNVAMMGMQFTLEH